MDADRIVLEILNTRDRYRCEDTRLKALAYLVHRDAKIDCSFRKIGGLAPRIKSSDLDSKIDDLIDDGLVRTQNKLTIGRDIIEFYQLTKEGVAKVEDRNISEPVRSVCSEYGEYPLANLLEEIRSSEPPYEWSE